MTTEDGIIPLERLREAPEIFIDGYTGAAVNSGVVKINLFSTAFNPSNNQPVNIAAGRLVMSTATLAAVVGALSELLALMERDGMLPQSAGATVKEENHER